MRVSFEGLRLTTKTNVVAVADNINRSYLGALNNGFKIENSKESHKSGGLESDQHGD